MLLSTLLQPVLTFDKSLNIEINQLVADSRQVRPGDIFVALQGEHVSGDQYIAKAIENGAVAIFFDSNNQAPILGIKDNIPHVAIPQLAMHLGFLAARLHHFPADKMDIIGVTGTNGKTSFCQFLAQCLASKGEKVGLVGTLGSGLYDDLKDTGFTTPDALTLQALLNDFAEQSVESVAMEVSSHAIAQHRVGGIEFSMAVFTNLTQDHLDYHGDMKTYSDVKKHFLTEYPANHLIINIDDTYGQSWANELADTRSIFAYSTNASNRIASHVPHIYAENIRLSADGFKAKVFTPWGEGELVASLLGEFNVSNVLAVLTALCVKGVSLPDALKLIAELKPVPGRMEIIRQANQPTVVVDFAHTPDALKNALNSLRSHTQGKLICVFGCGGDRDASKRSLMAKVAEKYSDIVIVTSDNPRSESPEAIAEQIFEGFVSPGVIHKELNRSNAIQKSIQLAAEGDCILIAGKGAERYQLVEDQKLPFDDVAIVKECLASS